ncbi:uncharacterized protein EV420DRAFT_242096 [Desarmillaria tabescens]|uniref:Uncharacterized protein n=1 Tax=Armillaria tabescens TaxID=1929756 RepID=A0AA39N6R1_ARMTA|nr:uncharacterized protein EV420DRAFT_242096 [Desarmillaria tabescens]KAK0459947.1 hypothetical protein EV420DRAFT_242096 [Desarmillaria tabescens]
MFTYTQLISSFLLGVLWGCGIIHRLRILSARTMQCRETLAGIYIMILALLPCLVAYLDHCMHSGSELENVQRIPIRSTGNLGRL